jgi:hypothetical protein
MAQGGLNKPAVEAAGGAGGPGPATERGSAGRTIELVEDMLNLVRPRHYFVAFRSSGRTSFDAVERGVALLVLPGDSVKVVDVRIRPLEVQPPRDILEHPRARSLAEAVGRPPALRLFQYAFTPLRTRVIRRLDTGAEFHEVAQEPDAPAIVMHVAHAYYAAYISGSRRIYDETPGGARAYKLAERGQLQPPQIYVHSRDKHRREIGVRIPLDEEQARQLITYLLG